MPKSKPKKPVVVLATDVEVIDELKRQTEYGVICEGFVDRDGNAWVTKRSLEAFERRRLERQELNSGEHNATE